MRVAIVQPCHWAADGLANLAAIRSTVVRAPARLGPDDLLILPEPVGANLDRDTYVNAFRDLSRELSCTIIGGSPSDVTRRLWGCQGGGLLIRRANMTGAPDEA